MPHGCDISEFQGGAPGGFEFYYLRVLNEAGRVDFKWEQHYHDTAGAPRGAYGIITPNGPDPNEYARRFLVILNAFTWELVPVIDIELGNAAANRAYAATVSQRLREGGHPVVMGYYSAGSAYRTFCQDLFERQWLASWGAPFPAGAHLQQTQGSPLDLDFTPDLGPIRAGTEGQDMTPAEHDALIQTRLIVQQVSDRVGVLASQDYKDVWESTLAAAQTAATWDEAIGKKLGVS